MSFGGIPSIVNAGHGHPTRWWRPIRWFLLGYVAIGLAASCAINLAGLIMGAPTAFTSGGSLQGTMILWFWWFFMPALTWPVFLYWTLYHWLFR
jgi:hypothetical protein